VQLFGNDPSRAAQYLGRVASTLGLPFTGSGGAVQTFPEVFLGDGLVVANALKTMKETHREIVWRHYVERWYYVRRITQKGIFEHTVLALAPGATLQTYEVDRSRPTQELVIERRSRPMKQQIMAERMGVSREQYHRVRDAAKAFLAGFLSGSLCDHTKVGARTPG